jgi:hypothetical protein
MSNYRQRIIIGNSLISFKVGGFGIYKMQHDIHIVKAEDSKGFLLNKIYLPYTGLIYKSLFNPKTILRKFDNKNPVTPQITSLL